MGSDRKTVLEAKSVWTQKRKIGAFASCTEGRKSLAWSRASKPIPTRSYATMIHSRSFAKCVMISLVLTGIVIGGTLVLDTPIAHAGVRERTTGSNFGVKYYDPNFPWLPHYGVTFRGSYGADQNYTGAGGNAATNPYDGGIKNWHWWGSEQSSLLVPKSWICYPVFNCGADRTNPAKYNAIVTR